MTTGSSHRTWPAGCDPRVAEDRAEELCVCDDVEVVQQSGRRHTVNVKSEVLGKTQKQAARQTQTPRAQYRSRCHTAGLAQLTKATL